MNTRAVFSGSLPVSWMRAVAWVAAATCSSLALAQGAPAATSVQKPAIKSSKVVESLLQDVFTVDGRLVAVGERGHIAVSDDSGRTWQQADVPTRQMLNAVYFIDKQHGWAVGHDGLVLNSTDGGLNWSLQLDGLKFTRERSAAAIPELSAKKQELEARIEDAQAALENAEAEGAADLSAQEEAVDALTDELDLVDSELGDAEAAMENTVANPLMDVWFRDSNTGFAVGAFGEFIATEDGGATWKSVSSRLKNPERKHLNGITGRGDLIYIVGEGGEPDTDSRLYRSTDGGQTWEMLKSPDPENASFFSVVISPDGGQVVIGGLRGALFRSTDQGNSWKVIEEDLHKNMNGLAYADAETLLAVGNDGAFLRSRDNGRTFASHVRSNRMTVAGVTTAPDGNYVLVGMGGVQIVVPGNL